MGGWFHIFTTANGGGYVISDVCLFTGLLYGTIADFYRPWQECFTFLNLVKGGDFRSLV